MSSNQFRINLNYYLIVTRYKNYKELCDGRNCAIRSRGNLHYLSLYETRPEDFGKIECRASNWAGSVSVFANLIVLGEFQFLLFRIQSLNVLFQICHSVKFLGIRDRASPPGARGVRVVTSHLQNSRAPTTPRRACGATRYRGSRPSDSVLSVL